ncbi:MAG: manganese efflux pump [Lachnospiraceae bacterium]|nr:manganese efflux pump [Lachnospiraceae bacterium]
MDLSFFLNSILLGAGLAMDAFSVSIANGLTESGMKRARMCSIAGVYAFFQFLMPMIGWICVHTIVVAFSSFERIVPWIALVLLCVIGGKMIYEGIHPQDGEHGSATGIISGRVLLLQGIATSIDALSVGFTIAQYDAPSAFMCSVIIAVVTFVICLCGLVFGKRIGTRFSSGAGILGGLILIAIGIEIVVKSFL